MTDSRDLSQVECDVSVTKKTKHLTACRRAQTSRMLCLCLYVVSLLSLSTLVLKVVLVVEHFCVAILFVNCCIRRCSLYTFCWQKRTGWGRW